MFTEKARHDFENGDMVSVGEDNYGNGMVVFDGPKSLETVIHFHFVEDDAHTLTFYWERKRRFVKTGSLEGSLDSYGDVGDYLEQFTR